MTSKTILSQRLSVRDLVLLAGKMGVPADMLTPDSWAESTEYDESWNALTHGRTVTVDKFSARIMRTVIGGDDCGVEVAASWTNGYSEDQWISLPIEHVPSLIRLMQEVLRVLAEAPKTLRRPAEVDAELQRLDN